MQGDFEHRITAAVAPARLTPYRQNGLTDLDVVCVYMWNLELSGTLYPALQTFEVGLRNALHNALTYRFGSAAWYDAPGIFLGQSELDSIAAAKDELVKSHKAIEPGRVVAELRFGFWSSLFNRKYEHRGQQLWPQLLARVFPGLPKRIRTRHTASKRVNDIRELRNRVFHHERITHWPLEQLHAELIEAIGWVCPALQHMTQATDRFPVVFRRGWQNTRRCLTAFSLLPEYHI